MCSLCPCQRKMRKRRLLSCCQHPRPWMARAWTTHPPLTIRPCKSANHCLWTCHTRCWMTAIGGASHSTVWQNPLTGGQPDEHDLCCPRWAQAQAPFVLQSGVPSLTSTYRHSAQAMLYHHYVANAGDCRPHPHVPNAMSVCTFFRLQEEAGGVATEYVPARHSPQLPRHLLHRVHQRGTRGSWRRCAHSTGPPCCLYTTAVGTRPQHFRSMHQLKQSRMHVYSCQGVADCWLLRLLTLCA